MWQILEFRDLRFWGGRQSLPQCLEKQIYQKQSVALTLCTFLSLHLCWQGFTYFKYRGCKPVNSDFFLLESILWLYFGRDLQVYSSLLLIHLFVTNSFMPRILTDQLLCVKHSWKLYVDLWLFLLPVPLSSVHHQIVLLAASKSYSVPLLLLPSPSLLLCHLVTASTSGLWCYHPFCVFLTTY